MRGEVKEKGQRLARVEGELERVKRELGMCK